MRTRRYPIFILSLCLTVAGLLSAVVGQESQFLIFSQYEVEVDGASDPQAAIYRSTNPPAFLVRVPRISSNYFALNPGTQKVEWLDYHYVSTAADGSLNLRGGYDTQEIGGFTTQGPSVLFEVDGHSVHLVPRKPLLDLHSSEDLTGYDPLYGRRAAAYRPDAAALKQLRQVEEEATVTVYFGSWCRHCQQKVPYILRLQQELLETPLTFRYYGLPRGFGNHPKAQELNLRWVPTAIVTRQGSEIGRVEGNDWQQPPEQKLAQILK
ncbi:MAG TPA: thioredoxin family protein [Acidobacteriota bacterium]|nr:thioredoxin family protein [Acidobacteriota bacterium]